MASSISYAISLCILFVIISLAFAEGTPVGNDYENERPYFLIRLKRSPQRAYTFSGFNPNSGYAAFATGADFLPSFYNYPSAVAQPASPLQSRGESYVPSSSNYAPTSDYAPTTDYQQNTDYPAGGSGGSSGGADEERKLPSSNLTPPNEFAPNTAAYNQDSWANLKSPKKKPGYPAAQANADDENDEGDNKKSKSSSHASFNAWFPIYVGTYPSSQGSESYKDGSKAASLKEGGGERSGLGTTIVSNSVSNGRSSVASSHAIAYGGEPPMQSSYRKG